MFVPFTVLLVLVGACCVLGAPQQQQQQQQPRQQQQQQQPRQQQQAAEEAAQQQNFPVPQIDWGKCPQLKPTDGDKEQKRQVIQTCLEQNPPPALEAITNPKQIDDHREVVTTCALKTEGWFNDDGTYKFDRARTEIESKKLSADIEKNISKRHEECQDEAVKRFPGGYIQQVQLYQACMDYHIAEICEIELIPPPGGFPIDELPEYDDLPPQNPPPPPPSQPKASANTGDGKN